MVPTGHPKGLALAAALLGLLLLPSCRTQEPTAEVLPSLLQPPIPEADPGSTHVSFVAEEGLFFRNASGSTVVIPPNSLVDAYGLPVKGPVTASYRELPDAVSIFLAGIPMEYQDGHFTTAGSFELRAFQLGQELELLPGQGAFVRMASWQAGDDYDFFLLDEQQRGWQQIGTRPAELNLERKRLRDKIARMEPELKFPLDRQYMAFNYEAILDIYYNDDLRKVDHSDVQAKMKAYGLGWTEAEIHQRIEFRGREIHAALMVWKNLDRKQFPAWTKNLYGRVTKLHGNTYRYLVATRDSTQQFSVRLEAIMPLQELFAFSPEKWKNNYEAVMRKIEEERERMQMMAEVYRTYEVDAFGLYNWDKLMKEEERVILAADFRFPVEVNERLTELTAVLLTGDNRSVISYPQYTWDGIALIPDDNARFFVLLPGGLVALYPAESFRQIDFAALKKMESPSQTFPMDVIGQPIRTAADFRALLDIPSI